MKNLLTPGVLVQVLSVLGLLVFRVSITQAQRLININTLDDSATFQILSPKIAIRRRNYTVIAQAGDDQNNNTTPPTSQPQETQVCAAAVLRNCHDICGGNYGSFCVLGQICDPERHVCEKAEP